MPTPSGPTQEQSLAAAAEASTLWGLDPVSIDILNESENIVCDLTLKNGRHRVMRLHRPGYNSLEELNSEVQWVEALAADGVPVPRQLPAVDGQYYQPAKVGRQERQVGVIEWVDGEALGGPLDGAAEDSIGHYGQIGELAGRIRAQSSAWSQPEGFIRRRWDADGLVGQQPIWGKFWEVESLSTAQKTLFSTARSTLHAELSALATDADRFGMIHADLHLGNVMAKDGALTVIDFDDAGFGWYTHELAVALHSMLDTPGFDAARTAMVTGYRRAHRLDDDEVRLIDTFLVIRCLMIVGWLHDRPELPVHSMLPELAAHAADVTTRYLTNGCL